MSCLPRGETSKKKSIPRKDRRHVEFFFSWNTELQGKKRMIIMTESTGYLDMNKKTFVNSQSTLFCFCGDFKPNANHRSLFFFENLTGSQPPKSQPLSNKFFSYSPRPEKNCPCFSPKQFFPPRAGFELTLFLTARASFPTGRRGRFPARAPVAAAAARCHVITWSFASFLMGWFQNWRAGSFSKPNSYQTGGVGLFSLPIPISNTTPQVHLTCCWARDPFFRHWSAVSHPKSRDLHISSHFRFIMTSLPVLIPQGPLEHHLEFDAILDAILEEEQLPICG